LKFAKSHSEEQNNKFFANLVLYFALNIFLFLDFKSENNLFEILREKKQNKF